MRILGLIMFILGLSIFAFLVYIGPPVFQAIVLGILAGTCIFGLIIFGWCLWRD